MGKVISVVNNKGGSGKTTSTCIMTELLAYAGQKVLAIDLDPQSNLSMFFNAFVSDSDEVINGEEEAPVKNISDLFKYRTKYKDREELQKLIVTRKISIKNRDLFIDILPSSERHVHTPLLVTMNSTGNNNIILKRALETIIDLYDYILIDNAPASDVLTINSMFASDYVLVPIESDEYSHRGLIKTINNILKIKEEHRIEKVEFLGAFMTKDEPSTNVSKDLKEIYREELPDKFFQTSIRKDIKIKEINTIFKSLLEYAPNTNAIFDYINLLLETGILGETETDILKRSIGGE